jgi:hypothetical protein
MITIKEMYRKKRAMELRDKVCDNDPLYMVYDFDPRETSFETWMGFYNEFHDFIPELTKKRFRDILREHRVLYNFRAGLNWWRGIKHPMRAIFNNDYFEDRLFPLSASGYGNWEQRVRGKKKPIFMVERNKPVTATGKGGSLKSKTFIKFLGK